MVRVACVQSNVRFGEPAANAEAALAELERLSREKVDLAIFPEAYLTGYCVETAEQARSICISTSGGGCIQWLREACDRLDMMAIVGFGEWQSGMREEEPVELYNSAALFEPGREPRIYRKSHLPELGLDKFVCPGYGPLEVFETRIGKLGILICFDLRIPEAARVLALKGADLLALPTNWPQGAEVSADVVAVSRAAENRIFVATCDRVGEENGFQFIGRSKIIGPAGQVLASAGDQPKTIVADLDLEQARQKRTVNIPGRYETEAFKSRRPELYGELTRDQTG